MFRQRGILDEKEYTHILYDAFKISMSVDSIHVIDVLCKLLIYDNFE